MKHTHTLGLVAACALLSSGAAFAQSSVTLYGRMNLTVESQKSGSNSAKWAVQNSSSRFGIKGSEDLGGGLRAGFQLESAVNPDNGTAGTPFWGRWSELNLSSNSLGTLRLGRYVSEAYFATADYVSNHNHDTGTSADALYVGFDRPNNGIGYKAPTFIPNLSLALSTSLSEGNAPAVRKIVDFAANYQVGALALGLGYNTFNTGFSGLSSANPMGKQVAVRAYYNVGAFGFGGYVQRDEEGLASTASIGSRTNVRLSAMYTMGVNEFHVNVGSAGDYSKLSNSSAKQFTLGYNHNLSKRTKVYGFVTKIDDSARGLYGGDFSSVAAGVRHNF